MINKLTGAQIVQLEKIIGIPAVEALLSGTMLLRPDLHQVMKNKNGHRVVSFFDNKLASLSKFESDQLDEFTRATLSDQLSGLDMRLYDLVIVPANSIRYAGAPILDIHAAMKATGIEYFLTSIAAQFGYGRIPLGIMLEVWRALDPEFFSSIGQFGLVGVHESLADGRRGDVLLDIFFNEHEESLQLKACPIDGTERIFDVDQTSFLFLAMAS